MIRSWNEGLLPLELPERDALDTCLGCRACETACPSGVEYGAILEIAREEIEERHHRPPLQAAARKTLVDILTNPGMLTSSLKAAGLLRPLTGGKMPGFAAKLLSGSSDARVQLPTPEGEVRVNTLPERSEAIGAKRHTVGILAGCVMRVLFGETNSATIRTLQRNGCEVVAPKSAGCCGALHLHIGLHSEAQRKARALLDAFEPFMDELDAIVINSAGCGSTMKEFGSLLENDQVYAERAKKFAGKVKDITEWLMEIGITPPGRMELTVSYHDACHLAHAQRIKLQPRELLKQIPGLNLVEMEDADTCCGSAGVYNILQPEMAHKLLERKVDNLKATGASVIATGNPGCLAWIQQGARERGVSVRICHPVELLDEAYNNL